MLKNYKLPSETPGSMHGRGLLCAGGFLYAEELQAPPTPYVLGCTVYNIGMSETCRTGIAK